MKKKSNFTRTTGILMLVMLTLSFSGVANAAILFQDDTFDEVQSDAIMIGSNDAGAVNTAIQFGADSTASENGNVTWTISTNRFGVDHPVDVTGDLTTSSGLTVTGGNVNISAASQNLFRKAAVPNTTAACTTLGEAIINTTTNRLEVCTTTGIAGSAVWSAPSTTIPTGAADPVAACTLGDLFYNTTSSTLKVCTAITPVWTVVGPQDFENVYAKDADKTLTTGGTSMTISSGGGDIINTTGTGKFTTTSTNTSATAISLTASTGAGGITATAGTGGLNFSSAAGAFALSGGANSTITTTGASDITITAGDDMFFDDAQLTSPVQLTDTATALAATFSTTGIIDAINTLTSTSSGAGASNVGIFDSGSYFTGTDVEAALQELGAVSGSNAANNGVLSFYPEYPDAVLFADGSTNSGTMESFYDDPNDEHYYHWRSNNATTQDYEIKFRFPLPADFLSTGDFTFKYRTGTVTEADNDVELRVYNATDETAGAPTLCGSDTTNGTANVWATGTITAASLNAGCTGGTALSATDIIEVDAKLYDNNGAADFADVGLLTLAYSN